ncbi:RDD family protein [Nocardia sp. NPDC023988]|uniref:RDD family protein n=1 Tax=unclassified Nocardia TaxID=2637762 RepID=UPI0033CFC078
MKRFTMSHSTSAPMSAIQLSATKEAMRKGRAIRWALLLFGVSCLVVTIVLIDGGRGIEPAGLSALVGLCRNVAAVGMTVGLIFGGALLWIHRRRRRALKRYPWVSWPVNYLTTGRYEWVELLDRDKQPVSSLLLSTWPKDIGKLVDHRTTEVWFAGDPKRYGVISRPGGADLRYAYVSKSHPAPRWSFRGHDSVADRREALPTNTPHELKRVGGRVFVKPSRGLPQQTAPLVPSGEGGSLSARRVLAFALDWVLHAGVGFGAAIVVGTEFALGPAVQLDWASLSFSPGVAAAGWVVASVFDRVIVQAIFHTTVGKAVFGLCVVRPDDGTHPGFGRLLAVWLVDLYLAFAVPAALIGIDAPGPDRVQDYFLPAVRRADLAGRC